MSSAQLDLSSSKLSMLPVIHSSLLVTKHWPIYNNTYFGSQFDNRIQYAGIKVSALPEQIIIMW